MSKSASIQRYSQSQITQQEGDIQKVEGSSTM